MPVPLESTRSRRYAGRPRRPYRATTLLTAACLAGTAAPAEAQTLARRHLDHDALAETVVARLGLDAGERVLLLGHPDLSRDWISPLRRAVTQAGGVDVGAMLVRDIGDAAGAPSPESAGTTPWHEEARRAYRDMFRGVDAAILLPGATSDHPAYQALQDLLGEPGPLRTIHLHWQGNRSVYEVPGSPTPPLAVVDSVYERAVLDTDYGALAEAQRSLAEALRTGEVRVTTAGGTDLQFRIGDRPVTRQDGDATAARALRGRTLIDREIEIPAGAVRVAPLESTVNGVVVIPYSLWSGEVVRELTVQVVDGELRPVDAAHGMDAVRRELAAVPDQGRRFREFALGFNPRLTVPEDAPWIPYYGYGAGVVRLAFGDNGELGGDVEGGWVKLALFTDATVTVDGTEYVSEGRLTPRSGFNEEMR